MNEIYTNNSLLLTSTKITEFESIVITLKSPTPNLLLYLFCCSISIIWAVYIVFFNSRIFGIIVTFLINKIAFKIFTYKNVYLKVSSISVSMISGKIMFRSVHYVTIDYMMYIQDGYIQFAFWRPESKEAEQEKATKTVTQSNENENNLSYMNSKRKKISRLEIMLNNLQIHYYNSWKQYYDFKPFNQQQQQQSSSSSAASSTDSSTQKKDEKDDPLSDSMKLFSIINIRIQKGRVYFGNNSTLDTILAVKFSNAKLESSCVTEIRSNITATLYFLYLLLAITIRPFCSHETVQSSHFYCCKT